jgi:twinkle protein
MRTFQQLGIKIPTGATGNIKTICPSCTPHNRKPENRNSKDLSVNIDKGIWNCHNCGFTGGLYEKQEKVYVVPPTVSLPLSAKTISYFKSRGINEVTLKHFHITEKKEWMPQLNAESNCILFPYIRNGAWVNVKYRDARKNFKLTKDAELILFNIDAIAGQKRVIITEGEIDAMSAHEAGFSAVCSVPNGATKGNQRLDYLNASWWAFNEADEVIIATDNDEAGIALKNELSRRLDRSRCREVRYPDDCKDLNEVLVKYGTEKVGEVLSGAKALPVEGVYRLSDFMYELDNVYENGFERGVTTGYPDFDNLLNFSGGQLTMITGVPNSGKSAFLDQVLIRLAQRHGWSIGVCSFENQPITRHAANLSSVYSGKPFFKQAGRMSVDEFNYAKNFLHDHFFWFKIRNEDVSLDGILNRARQLVKAYGIKALVIDPYNYIEHKRPAHMTETEYISLCLTEICNFAKDYDIHIFMVAHPTKIKKNPATKDFEIPTLYDISGSANFFNKTDNGFTVYRDRVTNKVSVYVQKVRFFFNGKIGMSEFTYDVYSGRYTEVGSEPPEPVQQTNGWLNPHAGFQNRRTDFDDTPF